MREELLSLNGVGPETADSILLYAGNHPVFVVDALYAAHSRAAPILPEKADYEDDSASCFERALEPFADEQNSLQRLRCRSVGLLVEPPTLRPP